MTRRILNDPVSYSEKFSPECQATCEGLLVKDPTGRLGFKDNSCAELKAQPLFRTVNWERLAAGNGPLAPCRWGPQGCHGNTEP